MMREQLTALGLGGQYLPSCECSDAQHILKIRALIFRNGQRQYAIYCLTKGWRGAFIPKQLTEGIANRNGFALADIPLFRDNRDGCCDGSGCPHCQIESCGRCGSYVSVELHHWAPSYLFDDSDEWPVSFLCRACHMRWHRTVTPRMHLREAG